MSLLWPASGVVLDLPSVVLDLPLEEEEEITSFQPHQAD